MRFLLAPLSIGLALLPSQAMAHDILGMILYIFVLIPLAILGISGLIELGLFVLLWKQRFLRSLAALCLATLAMLLLLWVAAFALIPLGKTAVLSLAVIIIALMLLVKHHIYRKILPGITGRQSCTAQATALSLTLLLLFAIFYFYDLIVPAIF